MIWTLSKAKTTIVKIEVWKVLKTMQRADRLKKYYYKTISCISPVEKFLQLQ